MRTYTLVLAQNLGNGALGNTLNLSEKITDLGAIKWEIDEQLTKLSPGDFSPVVLDYDGAIWDWIQNQTPSAGALYPPFLVLDIDGTRAFTGIVQPSQAVRDEKTGVVTLTAQDWSVMLASQALDEWVRPLPMATGNRKAGESKAVYLDFGDWERGNGLYVMGSGMGWPNAPIWTSSYPDRVGFPGQTNNWLEIGDNVTCPALPGLTYKVVGLCGWGDGGRACWGGPDGYTVQLSPAGFTHAYCDAVGAPRCLWQTSPPASWGFTLTRVARDTESRNYYTVTATIGHDDKTPCFALPLDTVDGLVPGDVVQVINSAKAQSWTILQIDAASKKAITREEVRDLSINDRIFFSEECSKEVVFEDSRAVLSRACAPFGCDLTRYTPPTLPVPVLVWLPLRHGVLGADLTSVKDMDQGFASLRVFGSDSAAWDGTPEAGWQTAAGALPRAHWTNQTLVTPTTLMPDETTTLSPATPRRYRPTTLAYRMRPPDDEDPDPGQPGHPGTWTPTTVPTVVLYDYLQMRRIQIAGATVTVNTWTGTTWGSNTSVVWPAGTTIRSACTFPGGPAGMVLGLSSNVVMGTILPGLTGTISATGLSAVDAADAVLRTTPWGAYVVGPRGYGRLIYNAGALSCAWVDLIDLGEGTLYPDTFTGIDENHVSICARSDSMDSSGKTVTETHLLLLKPTPAGDVKSSKIWVEKIMDGAAITLGAMRDPSQPGREIGHCGGRIFQVSSTLPAAYALERFTPSKMNSAELLEHVCQILQAVPVPRADGVMQILSRASITAPVALAVDQVEITDTRAWEHFYSLVRVTGATDDLLYDATGPMSGGKLLEVSRHPLIWSLSGCAALGESFAAWFGVPRRLQTQTWFWTDINNAPPWESLIALARLNVNGDTVTRMLTSLEYWPDLGEATAALVEA